MKLTVASMARVIPTAIPAAATLITPVGGKNDVTQRKRVVPTASAANAGSIARAAFKSRIYPVYR